MCTLPLLNCLVVVLEEYNVFHVQTRPQIDSSNNADCAIYIYIFLFFFFLIFDFFIQVYKSNLQSGLPLLSCYIHQLTLLGIIKRILIFLI